MLRNANMENYLDVCSNRISDNDLIDGEHIEIDFLDFPSLNLDYIGLAKCDDILKGYIDEDILDKTYDVLYDLQSLVDNTNTQLDIIRKCNLKTLLSMIFVNKKAVEDERFKHLEKILRQIRGQAIRELFSRTIFNKARLKIVDVCFNVYFNIRYFRLASFFRNFNKEYE